MIPNRTSNLDERTYMNLYSVVPQKLSPSSIKSRERGMFDFCSMEWTFTPFTRRSQSF